MASYIQLAVLLCLLLAIEVSFGDIISDVQFVGGEGPGFVKRKYTDGRILKKLEVWAGGSSLLSVKFHWTNGQTDSIGEAGGSYSSFTFDTGERLKSLSLWGNGAGTRCGAFKMITTTNREYFPQMTSWGLKSEYPAEVGSGIIIGFETYSGTEVYALGFFILRQVKSAILKDVTYPDININTVGLQPWDLESVDFKNAGSVPQSFTLKGSREVTTSSSWSITTSLEMSVTTTVEAGVPGVATVTAETTWKVGVKASYKREETHKFTKKYESPVTVGPGKHVVVTGTLYDGPINTKYTGTMHIYLDNGESFQYGVSGYYKGVTSSRVYKSVKEVNT